MNTPDYLSRIAGARTRFQAADLVLANAAQNAGAFRPEEALEIVCRARELAGNLRRDFGADCHSEPVSEDEHPWRKWLRDAGYPVHDDCPADPDGCTPETCTRNDCAACGAASNPEDRECYSCGGKLAGAPCARSGS